jgi:hypothetical protein
VDRREVVRRILLRCLPPSLVADLPGRLGNEGRECEPVVVLVFLEVGEGDDEEAVQLGSVAGGDDAVPYLQTTCVKGGFNLQRNNARDTHRLGFMVEQRSLFSGLELLDGVVVLQSACSGNRAVWRSSTRITVSQLFLIPLVGHRIPLPAALIKRLCAHSQTTRKSENLSRLSVLDTSACRVRRGERYGGVRELEDV